MSKRSKKDEKKENVQVVVRCRPNIAREKGQKCAVKVRSTAHAVDVNCISSKKETKKTYKFDHVFAQKDTQEDVYNTAVAPLVQEVLKGFNCTVFAYGQTGTGKTYTMEGKEGVSGPIESSGVVPRSVKSIFSALAKHTSEYTVKVSFMELYDEKLKDLIKSDGKELKIFDNSKRSSSGGGIQVQNLEEVMVNNPEDVMRVLENSSWKRHTAETKMNDKSSRSHAIFTLTIVMKEQTDDGEDLLKMGKLNLVDLAGSENIQRSGVGKQGQQEAGNINKSLLTLGRVINALTENVAYVPYRDSKLTRLLQDSLGGKTKTCIIATITPAANSIEETLSTLDYAMRAKNIKNKPEINQKVTKRALIKEYAGEIERLKNELMAAREKDGIYLPEEIFKEMEETIKEQALKIDQISEIQAIKLKELDELKVSLEEKKQRLEEIIEDIAVTKKNLKETTSKLKETKQDLKKTKKNVAQASYLISLHEETENKLKQEGETILASLKEAVADAGGLHSKIERKQLIDQQNSEHVEQFTRYVAGRAVDLEKHAESFKKEHISAYNALDKSTTAFVQSKSKDLMAVAKQISALLTTFDAAHESTAVLSEEFVAKTVKENLAMVDAQKQYRTDVSEMMAEFGQDASKYCQVVQEKAEKHKEQVDALDSATNGHITHSIARVNAFVDKQKEFVGRLQGSTELYHSTQTEKMSSHLNAMQTFAQNQRAQALNAQEELLAQIGTLIRSHFNQQKSNFEVAVNAYCEQMQQQVCEAEAFKEDVLTECKKATTHTTSFNTAFKKESDKAWKETQASNKKMKDVLGAMSNNGGELNGAVINAVESVYAIAEDNASRVSTFTEQGNVTTKSFITAHKKALDEFGKKGSATEKTINSSIKKMEKNLVTSTSKWTEEMNAHSTHVKNIVDHTVTCVQEMQEEISNFITTGIKEDIPTGETPVKKDFNVPSSLSKTMSHTKLKKKFEANPKLQEQFSFTTPTKNAPGAVKGVDSENYSPVFTRTQISL